MLFNRFKRRGQVPWQVLIKERRLFGLLNFRKCGGVLIAPRWVYITKIFKLKINFLKIYQ